MMEDRVARRLDRGGEFLTERAAVAILDIVGFSTLMARDQRGTLRRVRELQNTLVTPSIEGRGGRIVKLTGDGALVSFSDASNAFEATMDIQQALPATQQGYDEAERLVLRIGINAGDVLTVEDDVFGDCVNVAARLENLCLPGEILLSGAVRDELDERAASPLRFLGAQTLKNIPFLVEAYSSTIWESDVASVSLTDERPMGQALPDLPSIVVLPFTHSTGNEDDLFLCEGLSEDIITELSRFRLLFVIGRNSAFAFKDAARSHREIARELGVRYVLDGSLRRAGKRVRIKAQLLDAIHDRQIWAEHYDREVEDVFAVQDEITRTIVGAVAPELQNDQIERTLHVREVDLAIYELIAKASWHISNYSAEDSTAAQMLLDKALEREPNHAYAFALKSQGYCFDGLYGWHRPPPESVALAAQHATRSVALDPKNDVAQFSMGLVLFFSKKHREAIAQLESACELNPNSSPALGALGLVRVYTHDFDEAERDLNQSIRLSPREPLRVWGLAHLGVLNFIKGNHQAAIDWYEKAIQVNPAVPSFYRGLAASYGAMGEAEKARQAYHEFDRRAPGVTLASTRVSMSFFHPSDADLWEEALRAAGMPE